MTNFTKRLIKQCWRLDLEGNDIDDIVCFCIAETVREIMQENYPDLTSGEVGVNIVNKCQQLINEAEGE